MAFLIYIVILSFVSLLLDRYIYFRTISTSPRVGRIVRVSYVLYALVVGLALIFAYGFYWVASDRSAAALQAMMWVITIFFVLFVPKVVYSLVSLGDYVIYYFRRKKESEKGLPLLFSYLGVLLSLIVAGMMIYSVTDGRTKFRVERVEIVSDKLPKEFDGLKVAMFSDLHIGTLAQSDLILNRLVEELNALEPDVVINGGDLVNSHARELDQEAMQVLSGVEAKEGVFSVLGNHDVGIYIRDTLKYSPEENIRNLVQRQRLMGWRVLDNSTKYIRRGSAAIAITGFGYPKRPHHTSHSSDFRTDIVGEVYKTVSDTMFNIAITHAPQFWDAIVESGGADLTVAGHVHAMQHIFKIGNWRWSPARFWYDQWSGLYDKDGHKLYINDGVGCVFFHLRFGTKPEITFFELRSTKQESQ